MKTQISGHIPEKLNYVQRQPRQVSDYWEDDVYLGEEPPTRNVRETWVVEVEEFKTARAAKWAGKKPTVTARNNDPITEVEIVSLDKRGNGGRAWKVLIDGEYYVDLREDVMLDAIRRGKGGSGNMLKGPFVWCVIGTQMKLVRIGSKLYDAVVAAGRRKAAPTVKKSELEVGGIYEDKKGRHSVFLGLIDTEEVEDGNMEANRRCYGRQLPPVWKVLKVRRQQLWASIHNFRPTLASSFTEETGYAAFTTVKSRTVAGKVGFEQVPEDLFAKINKVGAKTTKRWVSDGRSSNDQLRSMATMFSLCRMRAAGAAPPQIKEIEPLVALVKEQFTA